MKDYQYLIYLLINKIYINANTFLRKNNILLDFYITKDIFDYIYLKKNINNINNFKNTVNRMMNIIIAIKNEKV